MKEREFMNWDRYLNWERNKRETKIEEISQFSFVF